MTAAAADRNTKFGYEYLEQEIQMAASQTIYEGTLVSRNASGLAIPAADTAATKLAGVAVGDKRNAVSTAVSGASDTIYVSVRRRGVFRFAASGLAVTDIGKKVYVADDQTVQLAATNVFAGYLVDIDSATTAWVEINTAPQVDSDEDLDIEFVGVAAAKAIVAGEGVALDADGYGVAMDDSTAISFWGWSLEAADNSTGADGDIDCAVQRSGDITITASALSADDIGKEVWQVTDGATVTLTPGTMLVGVISKFVSATSAVVKIRPMPIVGQRVDRQFTITGTMIGACGTGSTVFADRHYGKQYVCLQSMADALTAPGGAYVMTARLSDGTTNYDSTITAAAVHGENLTAQVPTSAAMLAGTDTDLTCTDDNGSGATADINIEIQCEAL